MNASIVLEVATAGMERQVKALLSDVQLPVNDVDLHSQKFLVANLDGELVGCIGLESAGDAGLLRSLAVDSSYRGRGIASALCAELIRLADRSGIEDLYLLTTSAAGYFELQGFHRIPRSEAPLSIQRAQQFTTLCPSTAVLMKRSMKTF